MSCIDKMSIMGIRSFDSRSRESIQFFSPLTLIVGQNGSGKTTIIECLKYATTGLLPPNTKGGAFIHDPKLCGEKEVLAQVKLAFKNTNQIKMICTRSLQLLVKKATRQQKTLDGQLLIVNDGERSTISNRCAELDLQVPLSLGVSRALLDYVIFCHQEESFWPLSEPSNLKKRFDEIFESMKYAKALEQLKNVRREQENQIKVDQANLVHFRSDKERAEKIRMQLHNTQKRISFINHRIQDLDQMISETAKLQDELFRSTEEYEQKEVAISQLENHCAFLKSSVEDLKIHMAEMNDPTEELEESSRNFNGQVETEQKLLLELENNKASTEIQITENRRRLETLSASLGRAEGELVSLERTKRRKQETLENIASSHEFSEQDEDKIITKYLEYLDSNISESDRTIQYTRDKRKERGARIEGLKAHELYMQKTITGLESSIRNNESNMESIQSRVQDLEHMAQTRDALLEEIKQGEREFQDVRKEYERNEWHIKIKDEKTKIHDNEKKLENFASCIDKFHDNANVHSKLQLLVETKGKLMASAEEAHEFFKHRFFELTSLDVHAVSEFDEKLNSSLQNSQVSVDAIKKKQNSANATVVELEYKVNTCRKELSDLESRNNEKAQLTQYFSINLDEHHENIQKLDLDIEDSKRTAHSLQFGISFYEKAIQMSNSHHACQLCQRMFEHDEEAAFVEHCRSMIENIPGKLSEVTEQLNSLNKKRKELGDIIPLIEEARSIKNSIKENLDTLTTTEQQLGNAKEQAVALDLEVRNIDAKHEELENLKMKLSDIKRLNEEIEKCNKHISELQAELSPSYKELDINQITLERKKVAEMNKTANTNLEKITYEEAKQKRELDKINLANKDREVRFSDLKLKINELHQLEVEIKNCCEKKIKMERDLEESKQSCEEQRPLFNKLNEEMRSLENELERNEEKSRSLLQDKNIFLQQVQDWARELQIDIKSELERLVKEKDSLHRTIEYDLSKLDTFTQKIKNIQEKLADLRSRERNISDNLRLRRLHSQFVEALERKNNLKSQQTQSNRQAFRNEMESLKMQYGALNAERAGLLGECRQLDSSVKQLTQDLNLEYKDSDERYRRQLIKTRTTDKANDDIGKYAKALDIAIMQLHSLKMNEINRIIDELWKQTYCGTDIDTILIRSDAEGKGNRSYNYRVCMVKGDAELDMRGRCSAGQKVLACIIIRLALAECLGVNCGILALDEPTTNLDEENITSLAKSLSKIVDFRRRQANFQLIIITHDEQFIRLVNTDAYCGYYYKVKRDANQKSIIVRETM
ncbi:DNA repair protein Rad50 [Schizosaccharomyces cryophilus OY26]|uniref:DNA repair protein RAD50 n=1 Tax=Schizosaccharomyces cryophilus (strain OY26 / ATCC MYA-4695 / CBS 11777 / NBRC 106824 / NRRL Y48691) TaxID=653667 RepID=S9W0I7_SCHCR|nr:DNA repair protein Rad50 [Schizosaccharomyces cryophilus OY26]EPY51570.1 DNA repair protein Rad50 [Schizosaccharomyces cryophilus OY26]